MLQVRPKYVRIGGVRLLFGIGSRIPALQAHLSWLILASLFGMDSEEEHVLLNEGSVQILLTFPHVNLLDRVDLYALRLLAGGRTPLPTIWWWLVVEFHAYRHWCFVHIDCVVDRWRLPERPQRILTITVFICVLISFLDSLVATTLVVYLPVSHEWVLTH